jgi:hypothetical protein
MTMTRFAQAWSGIKRTDAQSGTYTTPAQPGPQGERHEKDGT